jgi:hypothetical protein
MLDITNRIYFSIQTTLLASVCVAPCGGCSVNGGEWLELDRIGVKGKTKGKNPIMRRETKN